MGHLFAVLIAGSLAMPPVQAAQAARGVPVEVRVTDRTGSPVAGAVVKLEGGPSSRDGVTNAQGLLTLTSVRAATYRVRVEHERFVTLEKDVAVRTTRATVEAALTPAPPPPPDPTPPPAPAPVVADPPALSPGAVAVLSIPAMAEQMLDNREPVAETTIGCSGATLSRLIMLRQPLETHAHADADEMWYLVAGEATVTVGARTQNIAAGWFSVLPRTVEHAIAPRGRNPLIVLSTISGPPCK